MERKKNLATKAKNIKIIKVIKIFFLFKIGYHYYLNIYRIYLKLFI